MEWQYTYDDKVYATDEAGIPELVKDGYISGDTQVISEETSDWVLCRDSSLAKYLPELDEPTSVVEPSLKEKRTDKKPAKGSLIKKLFLAITAVTITIILAVALFVALVLFNHSQKESSKESPAIEPSPGAPVEQAIAENKTEAAPQISTEEMPTKETNPFDVPMSSAPVEKPADEGDPSKSPFDVVEEMQEKETNPFDVPPPAAPVEPSTDENIPFKSPFGSMQ